MPGVGTVLISQNTTSKEQAVQIKEAAGCSLAVALECTGVESSIHTAVYVSVFISFRYYVFKLLYQSMQFGGKVFIIGVGRNEQSVSSYNSISATMGRSVTHILVPFHASKRKRD